MKDTIQLLLLTIILTLQVIFTGISFDKARGITAGDIVSMIQVVFILAGFFIAYRQIIFSNKIAEANKIWEKICLMESSYIAYRTSIARKILDFIEKMEADVTGGNESETFSEYIFGIIKIGSEFQIKLKGVSDQILYKNTALDRTIERFLKREDDRIRKIEQDMIIVFSSKSKKCSLAKETSELGEKLSKEIIDDYKERFGSIMTMFEDCDYIGFKEEARKALVENSTGR